VKPRLPAACAAIATAIAIAGSLDDFQNRLAQYQKLHERAKASLPLLKPTASTQDIGKHERALAHRIHESREHTPQGNIFTPEITAEFKRLIAETMQGPLNRAWRAASR
jgi:hypothetical protein